MRLCLVGADFEENLGVGMIAASAQAAGHDVRVVAFNDPAHSTELARTIVHARPDVVGLSMQFQHRGSEFVEFARALRKEGFRGHLTCGGMLASAAWRETLSHTCFDSVVLYEGEQTVVELLQAIHGARPLAEVPGLAIRTDDGAVVRTPDRPRPEDLDALPFAARYRPHSKHLGVPFIPIVGSRGCWGRCAFCSISSFHLDARAHGGGKLLRQRSPEDIAQEMAALAGEGPAIFCFHDDNFLMPKPEESLERVRAIRHALGELEVGPVGIVGKTRPECLTTELARELRALGVIRLYVGIENTSTSGAAHLNRALQTRHAHQALEACRESGIFACYNLLLFEPETTLADVKDNVAFMRAHATHPVNFCRAEAYTGTPLHRSLAKRDILTGSWLGWNYRIRDDRAETLFRICAAAFRERNFASDGVANRYMGVGYSGRILEKFYSASEERERLCRRAGALTQAITLETADFIEAAIAIAERGALRDRDSAERQTAVLGMRIADADQVWLAAMDELHCEMDAFVAAASVPQRSLRTRRLQLAKQVAMGASLALGVGTNACGPSAVDPLGDAHFHLDATMVDPVPMDASGDTLPPDASIDAGTLVDPLPPDAGVDAGMSVDPLPPDAHASHAPAHWRDTSTLTGRTRDLPLAEPPRVALSARRDGDLVRVSLSGAPASVTTRWQSQGSIEGEGTEVAWKPASSGDSLRVAVRTAGGVAIVSLRLVDVPA